MLAESTDAQEADSLEARGVVVHFHGIKAVDGIDLELSRGEILGLIGPNGAGKTTLVNAITGFQPVMAGTVILAGRKVNGWSPDRLARQGLARTFQNVRLFGGLTAFENVEVGALGVEGGRAGARKLAWHLLERLGLQDSADTTASALPYGLERRLAIARALATRPRFLLLDEPAAGLNELEGDELISVIRDVRREFGCGVLVIDHDMRLIMGLCERIQVLDHGRTIFIGNSRQVSSDARVIEAYLGSARVAGLARD